jgi:hypothetical protein
MIPIFALLTQVASNRPSNASALERSISALESCISALDSAAESLGNSAASLEPWSWVFTALVAVGVAMEFWVIWHEHREDTETWALTFFGVHRTLRPHFGRLIAEYISVALVAGGIIGELAVGIEIASFNTRLRSVDAQLRSKNAGLRTASDQLVALINSKAEEAKKQAKDADLARTKLEKEIQPRTLDDTARKNISKELSKFASHFSGRKIKIMSYKADAEGIVFSLEVMDVITRAGIVVDPVIGRIEPVGLVDTGLNITGPTKDDDFIRALENSVHARLDTDICGEWNPKYSDLEILVAVKPIKGLPRYKSPTSTSPCSNVR